MEGSAHDLFWPRRAACTTADPGLFFPGPDQSAVPALALCAQCGVRVRCLQYALALDEAYGIWGGMTASGRRRLQRRGA